MKQNRMLTKAQTPLIRFVVQLVVRLVVMLWTCCGLAVGGILTHLFTKWRILTMTCYSLVALYV